MNFINSGVSWSMPRTIVLSLFSPVSTMDGHNQATWEPSVNFDAKLVPLQPFHTLYSKTLHISPLTRLALPLALLFPHGLTWPIASPDRPYQTLQPRQYSSALINYILPVESSYYYRRPPGTLSVMLPASESYIDSCHLYRVTLSATYCLATCSSP